VTHGITYLPEVDMIVVLKDGEVTELGTYKQLLEKKGAFAEFLIQHLQEIDVDDGTSEVGKRLMHVP
jgi:ATP-binding cassette subfamily C (CFTR/MRP) protein 1